MRKYKPKPEKIVNEAKQKIAELFALAEGNEKMADRYVYLARKISMKNKVRIPSELKRRFCKYCYCYLRQGKNVRVRRNKKGIVYTCLNCKKQMRFPI